ncbi:MAG: SHOCT domain-containing protein [Mycobacterium sp.]
MSRRTVPGVIAAVAAVAMAVSVIGFVTALLLNAFVFDDYDAYGEVPVPGSATVHLPAGPATISLHTMVIGGGGVLPVPKMSIGIAGPAGVPDPALTEDIGSTTTVNSDAHVRVWNAQIPVEGDYHVTTDGSVTAYVNPTLAFGHGSRFGFLPWTFVGIFVAALVVLVIARKWGSRVRRRGAIGAEPSGLNARPSGLNVGSPEERFVATDQGVRIQQLNNLARLRDSGALTEAEFEAEKKRVLEGY